MEKEKRSIFEKIPQANWGIRALIFGLICALAMVMTIIMPFSYAIYKQDHKIGYAAVALGFVIYILVIKGLYSFWKRISKDYVFYKRKHLQIWSLKNISYLILALVLYVSYHLLISNFLVDVDHKDRAGLTWFMILVVFLFQVISAPMIEELVTRGIYMSMFFTRDGEWNTVLTKSLPKRIRPYHLRLVFAIVSSAFISSMLHGAASDFAMYGLVFNGLLCAWLYNKTKHVAMPIVLHIFNNSIVLISMIVYMLQQ